jgi:hypothetical protein
LSPALAAERLEGCRGDSAGIDLRSAMPSRPQPSPIPLR